ncbi:phosphatase PAP2 family protein [Bdellovibrio sp. HCB117]|uniref:phosphatase PAP2 family protein n=1 Tax=Bdellovibrio sp. HCB117 TaxID=3394359 RepID=UPI0039B43F8D
MMLDFLLSLDKNLLMLINSQWTASWADQFFPFVTDLHKTSFFKTVLVPIVLGIFMWRRGIKKGLVIFFLCLAAISISDGVGNKAFKKTIQRPRPGDTPGLHVVVRAPYGGYSFVSNHATNMFCFASFTAIMFPAAAIPVYALATLIGYSRVYNGVHFPTDVFAGALLGIAFGILFALLCQKILSKMDEKKAVTS